MTADALHSLAEEIAELLIRQSRPPEIAALLRRAACGEASSDPANPGWVVDCDGEVLATAPGLAGTPHDADTAELQDLVEATLAWHGIDIE